MERGVNHTLLAPNRFADEMDCKTAAHGERGGGAGRLPSDVRRRGGDELATRIMSQAMLLSE